DQKYFARAGTQGRLTNRAALDLSGFARYADQHTRTGLQEAIFMHLVDEVLEHFFADAEVGDHPILHRADGIDVARRTTEHALGFGAHCNHTFLIAAAANGYDRGFVKHDAAFAHINQGIGCAQVDREIAGKHATQFLEHWTGTLGQRV